VLGPGVIGDGRNLAPLQKVTIVGACELTNGDTNEIAWTRLLQTPMGGLRPIPLLGLFDQIAVGEDGEAGISAQPQIERGAYIGVVDARQPVASAFGFVVAQHVVGLDGISFVGQRKVETGGGSNDAIGHFDLAALLNSKGGLPVDGQFAPIILPVERVVVEVTHRKVFKVHGVEFEGQ
jgi:hypothetical protein